MHRRLHALAIALVAMALVTAGVAQASCPLPYLLVNGQTPDATQMMANFNALVTCLNAGGSANSIQYNGGSGALAGAGPLTDGQLLIGSTGAAPVPQALTASSGVTVTNAPGSVTLATSAGAGTGLYQQVMSAVPTSSGTGLTNWLNQGTATVSDSSVGIALNVPANSGTNVVGRYMPAPSTPYTLTALIATTRNTVGGQVGIGWYDGTAKLQLMTYEGNSGSPLLRVRQFTNPTTASTINFTSNSNYHSQPIWFQIHDDGTNVTFSFSQDGVNFLALYTVAKASGFLGATGYSNVIFFINPGAGVNQFGTLLSWAKT